MQLGEPVTEEASPGAKTRALKTKQVMNAQERLEAASPRELD